MAKSRGSAWKPSKELVSGCIQWLSVGIGGVGGYAVTLSGFSEWNWFPIFCGALLHVAAGLAALALHLKRPEPEIVPEVVLPDTSEDLYTTADFKTNIVDLGTAK